MSKEIYISSTPHETRLAIVENDALAEIYYERENEYTLAGSIYNGKVTRVLPGMQSSFVDIGLERDAFLYITDFMEEAGDSADFDTTGNGDRAPRRDSRDHGNREAPTLEGTTAASTEDNGSRSSERNDRGDRGRDRGGRGRRDRRGNRDRQPSVDGTQPSDIPEASLTDFDRPVSSDSEEAPTLSTDGSDIGEGAPGADGSRRWRGRRGRRRGRGQRDESAQLSRPDSQSDSVPNDASDYSQDDTIDIEGAAERPIANETAPIPSAYPAPGLTQDNAGRRDRGDRDGRDDRNRRDRGGRDRGRDRDGRAPRVPRGFAPKTSLYGVDNTPYNDGPEFDGPAPEPIVLPGESLSKYRKPGEEVASSAPAKPVDAAIIIPQVASYAIPEGWDGGATLPGESLSRHRRSEPRQEFRNRPEPQQPQAQVIQAQVIHAQVIQEPDGVSVVPIPEEQPEVVEAMHPEVAATHQEEPKPATPGEYEPTEASASYRVDPVAPSEFRQSAPTVEPPVETSPESHVESPIESHVEPQAPSVTSYEKFDWQTEEAPSASVDVAPAPHELTTLHATGEMSSEVSVPAVTPQETAEQTAPIQHETAIFNPAENAIEDTGRAFHQDFVPGPGELEEETLDEEDLPPTLHASAIEELDDLDEEETLEGAADLGTMLREMSIDQITRSGINPEEEEDELEEEDSIDDRSLDDLEDEGDDLDETESEESEESDDQFTHHEFADGAELTTTSGFDESHGTAPSQDRSTEGDRSRGRRDGRRDGRRGDRSGRGDRARHTGGAGDRERSGGRDRRGGRSSMQSTNLPAISELLKPGQEILVQIAKEPIAKKGARITSHIALPGRFLVFMPTVNHTGVSRKIESDGERRRLKEILLSEKGEASGGFIVRTAASGASEEELRSDLRFLLNLWADIKQRSESSKSPALIYHDLNLVERILRDQVTDTFSAIWVDTETEYERVLRFLQRFQPSLIRRVKLYTKETPLFEQFGITEEINKALRSKVWLKSGGSIVINQTEALVAIDINTGKFVGKTARLEDTIVKTNLDAIPEIVRQIRLRDLGGIIIIDFIDMDERKNRNRVMAALEEELKTDRAPSKVLQFNDFGLVAITRKRVKQSLERTLSTTCNVCVGTGMVKSPVTVCNDIYIEMRKMQKHLDRGDVMLRVNPEVVKQLKAPGTKWLQEMEEMVGKTILVKSDPALHPEQFDIH
ncbi:MAG: ribonuclease, Rne/Rng family [Edaphobacter sp.]|nr:ribonuclease, Rne/Rng family [Edaphobacter sp.]